MDGLDKYIYIGLSGERRIRKNVFVVHVHGIYSYPRKKKGGHDLSRVEKLKIFLC